MLIRHENLPYKTDRSIIISGPSASGKSFLIERLRCIITKAPLVHREVAESEKAIPASSLIHWPAAEKFPKNMDFSKAGIVVMLGKDWDAYCKNVESRKHQTQYSRLGLQTTYNNWHKFFTERNLPIVDVVENDKNIVDIIEEVLIALKLKILY